MIYDVSVPIHDAMHVWPSDPGVCLETNRSLSGDGSHEIRVTSIHFGSHTGTHMDAPNHMIGGAPTLDDVPLEALVGPARVVDIPAARSITRKALEGLEWKGVERVLFRTGNSAHWSDPGFYAEFVYLEPDAASLLVEGGIRLVGIDYLSIDAFGSSDHPTHFVLLDASVVILEGLDLSKVPAGDYQLVALPLKLGGADGAPVRAILIN